MRTGNRWLENNLLEKKRLSDNSIITYPKNFISIYRDDVEEQRFSFAKKRITEISSFIEDIKF